MGIRNLLKSAEFQLPPFMSRLCLKLSPKSYAAYRAEDDALRSIFVHVPKAAGSSVSKALFDAKPRHVPLARYLAVDPHRFATYFKFGFVRNPWDRIYSAYTYLVRVVGRDDIPDARWATQYLGSHPTFESFVKALENRRFRKQIMRYIHFRSQADWMSIPGRAQTSCDYIGRFEHIEEDFEEICRRLKTERSLPTLRQSTHERYHDVYSKRMIDCIGEMYSRDIKLFGFTFNKSASISALLKQTGKASAILIAWLTDSMDLLANGADLATNVLN